MRIRLHPEVLRLVEQNKRTLSPTAEVNRALTVYYDLKKSGMFDVISKSKAAQR